LKACCTKGSQARNLTARKFESNPARIQRGEYLVSYALDMSCHSEHDSTAHDAALHQDLLVMRNTIDQYTLDKEVGISFSPKPEGALLEISVASWLARMGERLSPARRI
jgi:hypothetical protein